MRDLLRHAVAMLRNPRVVVLHLVLNALVLACASLWLLIPEEHAWQLAVSVVSALVLVATMLWLHSGTLAYAADPQPASFAAAFRIRYGRIVWMLLGSVILVWLMSVADGLTKLQPQISVYLYSKTPSLLRPTGGDHVLYRSIGRIFALLFWFVIPGTVLPLIAARVAGGGLRSAIRTLLQWRYWLSIAATALMGIRLVQEILDWTPGTTLRMQSISLGLRLLIAYLLATAAWLLTTGVLGYFNGRHSDMDRTANSQKPLLTPAAEAISLFQHCLRVLKDVRLLGLQLIFCIVVVVLPNAGANTRWQPAWFAFWTVVGLCMLVVFLWLQSGTLVYAADPVAGNFRPAFRFSPRRMFWLFLSLVVLVVLMACLEVLLNATTLVSPRLILQPKIEAFFLLFVFPSLLLPWTAAMVLNDGSKAGLRPVTYWRYWVGMAVFGYAANWLSKTISDWAYGVEAIPKSALWPIPDLLSSLPMIVGWLAIAGLVGFFLRRGHTGSSQDVVGNAAA